MTHRDTVDEYVMSKLNMKTEASDWIIGGEEQYNVLKQIYKIR